ncbi:hypothetical protein BFU36_08800 [Sulfolobus sp. A20]|uniref:hypothetical protein n=1 Tax=Sulfolobaceae TaxID=118883 RepID=UPI000846138D|nr:MULTISPECIES: hypothetical protein [unclassified Sulfolobus]TRM75094.1 hypothetical protein DJ532_11115 [Sulfolobus sp. A20-N-F8]TRM79628.1 hypothetical protein DJ528_00055 [Sulfolobus sp. B5]TRM83393.1 hypothetical protein DJ531_05610 [Sulfolobus sp. A20-N-F6]TRM89063.1 hypothetical protein DJ521_00715 [Sulfolobus sp. E3]TRM89367.1 hypothetical protein DJ529_02530 [Sulfolobus sp. C3]TRM98373.1 hypothetical protein DJ530_10990 [Sulfolobus sp. E1]TRN04665.1 hypothetical protein DJ527_00120
MINLLILISLFLVASLMVAIIVIILYYMEKIKTYIGVFFIYFSLAMMLTMFIGASIYLFSPSSTSLAIAFGVNMAIMISALAYFFIIAEEIAKIRFNGQRIHVVFFSILVVINEILMGTTFGLAEFGSVRFSTPYDAFYNSVNSYWFFYPMMAEMLAFYLIHYLRGLTFREIFPLIGVAAFPPTAFNYTDWFYSAVVLSLGFSALGILSSKRLLRYIYSALALTILLTLINPIPYDALIITSMIIYYNYILTSTLTKH